MIYLAGPYNHPDPAVRQLRFDAVTQATAYLVRQGNIVFSPLTHSHPVDLVLRRAGVTLPNEQWVTYDEAFMEFCSEMAILTIDGWLESAGVAREAEFFDERDRPIWLLDPADIP